MSPCPCALATRLRCSKRCGRVRSSSCRGDGVWGAEGLPGPVTCDPPTPTVPQTALRRILAARARPTQRKAQSVTALRRSRRPHLYPRADRASAQSFMRKDETFARTGYFWQRAAQRTPSPRPSPPVQRGAAHTMGAAESHTAKKQVNVDEAKAPRGVRPPPATIQNAPTHRSSSRPSSSSVATTNPRRSCPSPTGRRRPRTKRPPPRSRTTAPSGPASLHCIDGVEARPVPHAGAGCQVPGQVHAIASAAGRRLIWCARVRGPRRAGHGVHVGGR